LGKLRVVSSFLDSSSNFRSFFRRQQRREEEARRLEEKAKQPKKTVVRRTEWEVECIKVHLASVIQYITYTVWIRLLYLSEISDSNFLAVVRYRSGLIYCRYGSGSYVPEKP
jgi:hypothetical protein